MADSRRTPVYAEIVAEIQKKIGDGFFAGDNRLPSRKELCGKYNISDMTAWKVHNELERLGVAYKVRGKGVFACHKAARELTEKSGPLNPIRKVVFFNYKQYLNTAGYVGNRIFSGLQRRAFELGLNIRTELFTQDANGSYQLMDDEGLVVPYDAGCEWLLPMMERKRVRSVLVNNYFSEAHCVLNDNYSGISQLLDHLESQGCRSFILATRHFNSLGIANLSDRTYAFETECRRRELSHRVLGSGNYNELLALTRSQERPDAVMFTTDAPALKFQSLMAQAKIKSPPAVTGFDGWDDLTGRDVEHLTTIKVDYEGMGAAAVDVMMRNSLEDWHLPDVMRVPCRLLACDASSRTLNT